MMMAARHSPLNLGANYTGTGTLLADTCKPHTSPDLVYTGDFDDPPNPEGLALFKDLVLALRAQISDKLLITYSSFYEVCCVYFWDLIFIFSFSNLVHSFLHFHFLNFFHSNNFLKTHR